MTLEHYSVTSFISKTLDSLIVEQNIHYFPN
jgi:hypothetical protein